MASWKKAPEELQAAFAAALPSASDVEPRKMFGFPCAFVNGNMFAGLHEDRLIVRVPEEAAAYPCVIMGRTMKEYVLLAEPMTLTAAEMSRWVARAYEFARALPGKAPKSPRSSRAAKAPTARKAAKRSEK